MNITLTGTKITQDNKFLAFEKNNGVDVINITVDTDESWTYKLDVKYPDKCCSGKQLYNIINLTRTGNTCTAVLTKDMLPFTGKYIMQLRSISGDKVYHSDTFDAWIKYSIEPSDTYDPVPSEFYQIEDNITKIEANVTEMNNNPPYPSDDGYWMIWDFNTHAYKKSDIKIIDDLRSQRVTIFHVTGRNPMTMDITLDELNAAITAGNVVFAIRATGQDANPVLVYRYQETRTYTYSADSTSTKHVFVCVTKPEAETVVLKNTPTLEVLCVNVNTGFIQRSSVYTAKVLDVVVNNTNGQLKTTVPVQYISAAATSGVFNAVLQVHINGNNTTPYEIYQVVSSGTSGTSPNYVTTVKCARYDGGKLYELTFTGPLSSTDANDTVVTKTEMTVLPAPATGTVGQLIKVKAADTYGNITETETVDDTLPTPSAENVGKIPVSKQVGDGYKYVMEDKSTSDFSLGVTGASVGDIIKVKQVDVDGKPTAWDSYSDQFELLRTITITETTNTVSITQDENGDTFSLSDVFIYCDSKIGQGLNYAAITYSDNNNLSLVIDNALNNARVTQIVAKNDGGLYRSGGLWANADGEKHGGYYQLVTAKSFEPISSVTLSFGAAATQGRIRLWGIKA